MNADVNTSNTAAAARCPDGWPAIRISTCTREEWIQKKGQPQLFVPPVLLSFWLLCSAKSPLSLISVFLHPCSSKEYEHMVAHFESQACATFIGEAMMTSSVNLAYDQVWILTNWVAWTLSSLHAYEVDTRSL